MNERFLFKRNLRALNEIDLKKFEIEHGFLSRIRR